MTQTHHTATTTTTTTAAHSRLLYILDACNEAQAALAAGASCTTLQASMAQNAYAQDALAEAFACLAVLLPQGFDTPAP